ncbi:unnamed protein product [Ostreobium quekettii]|uniref:Small nuclear ribonucleoprotein Prp3 C-terminal domain-containing protein n=1 Tax=Ostreobium quekettii TaxID=121088 RepID=A0A8S1J618_9CHLO|nr:unnamed protein product [Ostreobium quekettii]
MGVRVIWFHHIKSPTKRSHIVNWARELGLRGFSKPGYPGIVICEGSEEDVVEYVSRLRHLKWKAMQVRAETTTPLATPNDGEQPSDIWHFNDREFLELGENGLSELATLCREAGLEEMFLSALKISR